MATQEPACPFDSWFLTLVCGLKKSKLSQPVSYLHWAISLALTHVHPSTSNTCLGFFSCSPKSPKPHLPSSSSSSSSPRSDCSQDVCLVKCYHWSLPKLHTVFCGHWDECHTLLTPGGVAKSEDRPSTGSQHGAVGTVVGDGQCLSRAKENNGSLPAGTLPKEVTLAWTWKHESFFKSGGVGVNNCGWGGERRVQKERGKRINTNDMWKAHKGNILFYRLT